MPRRPGARLPCGVGLFPCGPRCYATIRMHAGVGEPYPAGAIVPKAGRRTVPSRLSVAAKEQQYVFMVHLSLGSVGGGATPFPSLDFRGRTTTSRNLIGGRTVPASSGRECRRLHRVMCAAFEAGGDGNQRNLRRECPQGRCAQTQSAPDKDDGAEEVDQAQQAARSVPGPKGEGEVQGRATEEVNDRADLLARLRVLVAGASQSLFELAD
jgi:hypothetical protein